MGPQAETHPDLFDRNMEGFWIARDADGVIGGIFLIDISALGSTGSGTPLDPPGSRIQLKAHSQHLPLLEGFRSST